MSFSQYMLAQSETRKAYQQYCYAGANLELAQIKERLAEIKSQSDPIDSLLKQPMSERDRLYAIAFYVVNGRFEISQEKGKENENACMR